MWNSSLQSSVPISRGEASCLSPSRPPFAWAIKQIVAISVVSYGIYVLHKRIEKEIERLKEL